MMNKIGRTAVRARNLLEAAHDSQQDPVFVGLAKDGDLYFLMSFWSESGKYNAIHLLKIDEEQADQSQFDWASLIMEEQYENIINYNGDCIMLDTAYMMAHLIGILSQPINQVYVKGEENE